MFDDDDDDDDFFLLDENKTKLNTETFAAFMIFVPLGIKNLLYVIEGVKNGETCRSFLHHKNVQVCQ